MKATTKAIIITAAIAAAGITTFLILNKKNKRKIQDRGFEITIVG